MHEFVKNGSSNDGLDAELEGVLDGGVLIKAIEDTQ